MISERSQARLEARRLQGMQSIGMRDFSSSKIARWVPRSLYRTRSLLADERCVGQEHLEWVPAFVRRKVVRLRDP
jgi:hypothetical protein